MAESPGSRNGVNDDLTRLERDVAVSDAIRAERERDAVAQAAVAASAQRDAAIVDNVVLDRDARDAKVWGAQNAAARTEAETARVVAEDQTRSSNAALFTTLGILALLIISWLIWYMNQPKTDASSPTSTTIVHTGAPAGSAPAPQPVMSAPTPPPPPVIVNSPTPASAPPQAPAAPVIINNSPSAAPSAPMQSNPPMGAPTSGSATTPGAGSAGDSSPAGTSPAPGG